MQRKKKRADKEAVFCTKLQKWAIHNMEPGFNWEAKYVYKYERRYNYKADKSLQKEITNLTIGEKHGIMHKYSDIAALGTMFDGSYFKGPGYFFFQWEVSSPKFYIIKLKDLVNEIDSGLKSLTEQRAKEIAWKIGKVK